MINLKRLKINDFVRTLVAFDEPGNDFKIGKGEILEVIEVNQTPPWIKCKFKTGIAMFLDNRFEGLEKVE